MQIGKNQSEYLGIKYNVREDGKIEGPPPTMLQWEPTEDGVVLMKVPMPGEDNMLFNSIDELKKFAEEEKAHTEDTKKFYSELYSSMDLLDPEAGK
ncbi:MAG: hypothetical protein ABRQ38_30170 [Candidatus Eremiobacterota bacterium]